MDMDWAPVRSYAPWNPGATPYGFMVDYLWAVNGQPGEQGTNVARLPHWRQDMFIVVDELHPDDPGDMFPHTHDVFTYVDGHKFGKYRSSDEDMQDWSWQVAVVEWEPA